MVPSANCLGLIMTNNSRVFHVRGFTSKLGSALKSIKDGNSVWVVEGELYRDATLEEMHEAMTRQASERVRALEILGRNDIPGLTFERPKTTNYQQPWAAYEEMEAPMGVRYCRWPRRSTQAHDFVMQQAA